MNNTNSKRKPYVREMKKDWWLKNAFYTGYMIREGTSIFVSIYAVVLMWGLLRLVQGQEAFNGWLESLQSPIAILFHVIALAACLFHAKTWFALARKPCASSVAKTWYRRSRSSSPSMWRWRWYPC